jgi:geranylgeranyl diphosphate synthase type I
MEAKQALADIALVIDKEVERIVKAETSASRKISPIIKELLTNFPVVCFGGKRLRGAFAYYSYLMHGGRNREEIIKVGAALEILHSYLLAHDDMMDRADMRHFKPTINKYYEAVGKLHKLRRPEAVHFGNSIAVNAGDVLCHVGLDVLVNAKFEAHKKLNALSKVHNEFRDTGYGQVIDVFSGILNLKQVDEDYVMLVHYFKTGKYTYETPLHVGAILAGADREELEALTRYAIPGGIAFQIQDDILGMFGDAKKIGKSEDADIREGKKTLLIVKALEKATPSQKKIIYDALGNPDVTKEMQEKVRKVIIDTGSLDYSRRVAKRLVKKAQEGLNLKPSKSWKPEGKDFLEAVAKYMIEREI